MLDNVGHCHKIFTDVSLWYNIIYYMEREKHTHGYLIFGDKDDALILVKEKSGSILGEAIERLVSNLDFSEENYDLFGIDEARRLKERAFLRPFSGDKKVFIISSRTFTAEAQNALLKLFEEPSLGTYFFIITQNANNILSTLKSRLTSINLKEKKIDSDAEKEALDFFASNPAKRLLIVNKIIENKDKTRMDNFLNSLEISVVKKIDKNKPQFIKTIEDLQKSREYMSAKGASLKLIFEYLALSLPII